MKNIPAKNVIIDVLFRKVYITFRRKGRMYVVESDIVSMAEGFCFDSRNFGCFYIPREDEGFFYECLELDRKTCNKDVISLAQEKIMILNNYYERQNNNMIGGYFPQLGEPLHFYNYYGK